MKPILIMLEKLFLFSPTILVFTSIFNFSDVKSIVSRLSVVVILYCLVRYRHLVKNNWNNYAFRRFFIISFVVFFYFTLMHLWRGDNFGLPRTLLTSLIYLLVVPWGKFNLNWFYVLAVFSSFVCGANAIYEYFFLHRPRVGVAVNPIPFALYSAVLSIITFYIATILPNRAWKAIAILGGTLSAVALLLTSVRGVWIIYPIGLVYIVLISFKQLPKSRLGIISILTVFALYTVFEPVVDKRIASTLSELEQIQSGNYQTSIGARLDLWLYGWETFVNSPILGVGDRTLKDGIKNIHNRASAAQGHLHNQYLDYAARYGVIGVVLMLVWLILPIMLVSEEVRQFILITSTMIALAGLTDIPLHHTHVVYLFSLIVGCLVLIPSKKHC